MKTKYANLICVIRVCSIKTTEKCLSDILRFKCKPPMSKWFGAGRGKQRDLLFLLLLLYYYVIFAFYIRRVNDSRYYVRKT